MNFESKPFRLLNIPAGFRVVVDKYSSTIFYMEEQITQVPSEFDVIQAALDKFGKIAQLTRDNYISPDEQLVIDQAKRQYAGEDKEYLTLIGIDIYAESERMIEKAESKGSDKRKFFKVDAEGFIYVTEDRPSHIYEYEDNQ